MQESRYLKALQDRVLLFDGAMGTEIQVRLPDDGAYGNHYPCNEFLNLSAPQLIEDIHRSYLNAGADVIETNTFGGNVRKLAEFGLESRCEEINRVAAQIAVDTARGYSPQRFVAGSVGPSGLLPGAAAATRTPLGMDELIALFLPQIQGLLNGGVDVLLMETGQDLVEIRAQIFAAQQAMEATGVQVPIQAQFTMDEHGHMLLGSDAGAAMEALLATGVDLVGMNCSTGPQEMRDSLRLLSEASTQPISCIPNAGMPENVDGVAHYTLGPEEFARLLVPFVREFGLNVIGGCCGTGPDHIRELRQQLQDKSPQERPHQFTYHVSSQLTRRALQVSPGPLLVGERINAQGSRRVRKLLLQDDYAGVTRVARRQEEQGAHILDVCVALTERDDEVEQMLQLLSHLAAEIELPLMIDSVNPKVQEAALQRYPGRVVVNSVNLENRHGQFEPIMKLVVQYGAAVVGLTIDEKGMAGTPERKLEVARHLIREFREVYHLTDDRIIIDLLTFTLGTGEEKYRSAAVATLQALRQMKQEFPGVSTILGVSNISYGLPATVRRLVTSGFLYHAAQSGLDLAIVNPAAVIPWHEISSDSQELVNDLIFNRRPDALNRLLEQGETDQSHSDRGSDVILSDPVATLQHMIVNRDPARLQTVMEQMLKQYEPRWIISEVLLPAMKEVGDGMARGELILPFVLRSAEIMKQAVRQLEPLLQQDQQSVRGKVVLATVFGDVHDIGKNLVRTILENNGYRVTDLGKQVPVSEIVNAVERESPLALGLSALLVSTSRQAAVVIRELESRSIHLPVLLGGAAINPGFTARSAQLEDGTLFPGGVYYARDAFAGLNLLEQLQTADSEYFSKHEQQQMRLLRTAVKRTQSGNRLSVRPIREVPIPISTGSDIVQISDIDTNELLQALDKEALFRLNWGVRLHRKFPDAAAITREYESTLARLWQELFAEQLLQPAAVLADFYVEADENRLQLFRTATAAESLGELTFNYGTDTNRSCLTDWIQSPGNQQRDLVALQCVTVGRPVLDHVAQLQKQDQYLNAFLVHGLAMQTAEALAEITHQRVRSRWQIPSDQGLRFSPGYAAWTELSDQRTLFRLLEVTPRLGITLTRAYAMDPEASTSAIVLHHPDARYIS